MSETLKVPEPDGWIYEYPDRHRSLTNRERNGSRPSATIPYYTSYVEVRVAAPSEHPIEASEKTDVETLAAKFHEIYMIEARRQGDVRHKDAYADLADNVKEFYRVLARYVLANFAAPTPREASVSAEREKGKP